MALQLRVTFASTGQTKAMRFTSAMSISETLHEIKDKTGEGGRDHGLMRPADPKSGRTAKWLQLDRTLMFYDIKANEELLLKKKHRPLKIELADGTIKTFLIDDSLPVADIVEEVGKKMGLRNPEEFSLRLQTGEDQTNAKGKKKRKDEPESALWLHPGQALAEQGVHDEAVLVLKKKYYVDDCNVDRGDPIQLHLVYVQSHEAIVNGDHQVTKEEAYQFAALQCQIVYGNFNPEKHNEAFFKSEKRLESVCAKQFRKGKCIEGIINEWKKLINQNDTNAKYRYVQSCRSLKTYGITYYNVKWKAKGRKKLEPILAGITRDNIIFVDPDDREVKEEYPLTHLKRWAAAPASFTFDFGDYREEYLSVQTAEGEAISQLLAGYIDILLKRRKDGGVVVEEEEGELAHEEIVGAIQGTAAHSITTTEFGGGLGDGGSTAKLGGGGQVAGISPGMSGMLGQVGSLLDADNAILNLMNDLMCPMPIGSHGSKTPDMLRQELAKYNSALAAAAGALIKDASNGASRADLDKHSPAIALNLAQLIGAAKLAAAAAGGDVSLLDGAKAVSEAMRKLMTAAGNMADNPSPQNRAALAEAAALLQATSAALNATATGSLADEASKNLLMESAKAVAAAARDLVNTSQNATAQSDPQTKQKQVEGAQRVDFGGRKVEYTAAAVSPVIVDAGCQKFMTDAARVLGDACGFLVSSTQGGIRDPGAKNDLNRAAKSVNDALKQLIDSTQCVSSRYDASREAMAAAAFQLQDAVAKVMSSAGNAQQIMTASVAVRDGSASLINAAKLVSNDADANEKQRLLKAMMALTNNTKGMLGSAQLSAKEPQNDNLHKNLRDDAGKVADAAREILGDMTTKDAALAALRTAAKCCAAATSGLIADAKNVSTSLDPQSAHKLNDAAAACALVIAGLVSSVRENQSAPRDAGTETALVGCITNVARPTAGLVADVRTIIPNVRDPMEKKNLNNSSQAVTESLRKMMDAMNALKEADGHMEVDEALENYKAAQADLDYAIISAGQGQLEVTSGQSREGALHLLTLSTDSLKGACSELADASAVSPQAMGPPAKKTTNSLQQVFGAAKAVASATDGKQAQTKILVAAKGVATETERLINAGRALSVNTADAELNANVHAANAAVYEAVAGLLSAASNAGAGAEECDQASDNIQKTAREVLTGFGGATGDLQDFADELVQALKALDAAVTQVVDSAKNNPKNLGPSASLTASTMPAILKATNSAAAKSPDPVCGENILGKGKALADNTVNLLSIAKNVSASPDDYAAQQALGNSAKVVRDDIKELLKAVDAAIPGKRELVEALELITAALGRLGQPSAGGGNSQTYLKEVQDAAKVLASSVGRIAASARQFPEKLGPFGKQAAEAVSEIVDATQDASSIDIAALIQLSAYKLARDVRKLAENPGDAVLVIEGTKDVARDAGALLANVKRAAKEEKDSRARQQLILATEALARATEELAAAAKGVANHEPGADHKLADKAKVLEAKIRDVLAYKKSQGPNFRPLVDATTTVADESVRMIEALKVVSGKPKDGGAQTQLSVAAQATTAGIRSLIQAAEELTFGHRECKDAVEAIQRAIGDLDATAINAAVGILPPAPARTTNQQFKEELIEGSRNLAATTGRLVEAAKASPENLGSAANEIQAIVPGIVESSKNLAATTADPDTQQSQLQLAKNMTDSLLPLVVAARETSSNPSNKEALASLAAAAKAVSASITDLVARLRPDVVGLRTCDEALSAIEAALSGLGRPGPKKTYAQASEDVTKTARDLVAAISQMVNIAKADPDRVGDQAKAVAAQVPRLVEAANAAFNATTEEEVRQKLVAATKNVIQSTRDAVGGGKNVAADPKNTEAIAGLSQQQRVVTGAIGELLHSIRLGATLERDADSSVAKINATIADLDSASLFVAATAGSLDVELAHGQTLDTSQAQLSRDAKQVLALIGTVQKLSAPGAPGGQEALGKSFKDLSGNVGSVANNTKAIASLMHDMNSQQDVLTAAKAMAIASQSLILASKEAMAHPDDPSAKQRLAESSRASASAASDMIGVSERASAEAVRGLREIEKAEAAIKAQQGNFGNQQWPGTRGANAEAVVKAARILAAASGNIVSTCTNDTDGLVKAAQACGSGVVALLGDGRGAAGGSDDPQVRAEVNKSLANATNHTLALLAAAKTARDTPDSQKQMTQLSERVADSIMEIVTAARKLPGGAGLRLEEDTGDDLDSMAERELMKAAKMIEEAAKRLLAARPKKVKTNDKLDEQDINAAILEAARAITIAVGALVGAASNAQRERIAKSRDPAKKHFYRKDPAWANGLISAAQSVGGTTQDLVSCANGFVKKEDGNNEELLIASAKQVAAATARLMAASRAKSDPFSDSHKNLSEASKSVASATQALVEAARMAGIALNEPEVIDTSLDDISVVQSRKEQLRVQAEMIRLENELSRARNQYHNINKAGYSEGGPSGGGGGGGSALPPPVQASGPARPLPSGPPPGGSNRPLPSGPPGGPGGARPPPGVQPPARRPTGPPTGTPPPRFNQ
eukprot:TRINITY_DN867_c0_g1_i1.p1 TRINITY_DN867_c0_g1~~TRINITY_DN867_c0_g1_i1.p1  ORF type:complete len:2538 (-),score=652.11 TRINITY_DN867_c0_g1_i1:59-7672(-)